MSPKLEKEIRLSGRSGVQRQSVDTLQTRPLWLSRFKVAKVFAESQSAAKLPDKPACIGVSLFSRN